MTILLALAPLAGCGIDSPSGGDELPGEATLEIPLQQIGTDGALYRLQAVFSVRNGEIISFLDATGDETAVRTLTTNGRNEVRLLDGFTLRRSTDGGETFEPVQALLASANPVVIDAKPGLNTVKFDFVIRTPATVLAVTFGVEALPVEIAGTLFITEATNFYEPYLRSGIPFRAFYRAERLSVGLDLATNDVFCPYRSDLFAIEYLIDDVGLLAAIGPQLAGSSLRYEVRALGSAPGQTLSLSIERPGNTIAFPRTAITPLALDGDGCPSDPGAVGAEISLPFSQTTQFGEQIGTISGTANLTFIPPAF